MKHIKSILFALVVVISLVACSTGMSKDELTKAVREDINAEFAKDSSEDGSTYSITNFTLVHKGGNTYTGVLETIEDGEEFYYDVEVTVDGDSYVWKILE